MTSLSGEDALVEQPAIEWLQAAGWKYVHGRELPAEAPGAERRKWSDVVLIDRLREAVARINPHLARGRRAARVRDRDDRHFAGADREPPRLSRAADLRGADRLRGRRGRRAERPREARRLRTPDAQRATRGQPADDRRGREQPPAGHPAVRQRPTARAARVEGAREGRLRRRRRSIRSTTTPRRSPASTATWRSSASPI